MTKQEFEKWFIETFAPDVPQGQLNRFVFSNEKWTNYLWHLFSWEVLPSSEYLKGDEAQEAYDRAKKNDAEYFDWFKDDTSKIVTREEKRAALLDEHIEVYVFSKNFGWVYMKTHEGNPLGPYFISTKMRHIAKPPQSNTNRKGKRK